MLETRAARLDAVATSCVAYAHEGRWLLRLVGSVDVFALQRLASVELMDLTPSADDEERRVAEAFERMPDDCLVACDLRDLSYIELPALLYINGLLTDSPGATPLLARLFLPEDRDVLHFLLRWSYVQAFADAVGATEPNDVILGRTDEFHATVASLASKVEYTQDPSGNRVRLLPRRYYEIKSFLYPHMLSIDLAEEVASAWCEPHVVEVMNQYLGGELGPWFAHNVIMQLVENALIHPHATLIQHCAQHERIRDPGLKVAMWDNGDSIISTVLAALQQGSVTGPGTQIADFTADVTLKSLSSKDPTQVRKLTFDNQALADVNEESPDWRLLLASLMPGVSARLQQGGVSDMLGLGLHRIAYSTTRHYGGSFHIRTKDILLTVRPALGSETASYSVDIDVLPKDVERFHFTGNLLSVWLPPRWTK